MGLSQLPLLLLAAATTTLAQDWHFVAFTTPDGQEFISQSGNMIVPAIHEAATNYLWPGLQSTDNSGVYQNVLDGRSGGWWFGSGWCCSNPSKCYCVEVNIVRRKLIGEFRSTLGWRFWRCRGRCVVLQQYAQHG